MLPLHQRTMGVVGVEGFEPSKPKRLIYSQVGLAIPQHAQKAS